MTAARTPAAPPPPSPARQWRIPSFGAIDALTLSAAAVPPPQANELRVAVKAVGLNFADVFACLGLYELAGPPPLTPGFEIAGVVTAVGADVSAHEVGDRVFALTRFGGYATVVNVAEEYVHAVPEEWSFEHAAAYPVQAFTAWYALCVLGALPSDGSLPVHVTSQSKNVLIHSAAGGVGLQLIEIVRRIGGNVVCTVGSEKKLDLLRERGVERERIIVRGVDDRDGFEKVVREKALGGEGGIDVVVDSVMGDYFNPGFDLLNKGGRYIVMGSASMMPRGPLSLLRGGVWGLLKLGWKFLNRPKLDLVGTINANKTVSCFNLADLFDQTRLMQTGFRELAAMKLPKPKIGKTFSFENAPDALKFFQTGQSVGKLVLVVDGEQS